MCIAVSTLPSHHHFLSYTSASFLFDYSTTPEFSTLSLHDALPISGGAATGVVAGSVVTATGVAGVAAGSVLGGVAVGSAARSEEHTSELQSLRHLVCRLLLEKKKEANNTRKRVDGGHMDRPRATER